MADGGGVGALLEGRGQNRRRPCLRPPCRSRKYSLSLHHSRGAVVIVVAAAVVVVAMIILIIIRWSHSISIGMVMGRST